MRKYNVAIVGATGAVGTEFITLLKERGFPLKSLKLLASSRSAGRHIDTPMGAVTVEEATPESFKGVDIAFFSAGGSVSKELVPSAVQSGALAIDNTSAFRLDPNVPLVVPEANADAARHHRGVIANPNCSTTVMVVAIKPIYDAAGIKRIVVSTYQAVSGSATEDSQLWKKRAGDASPASRSNRGSAIRLGSRPPSDCLQPSAARRCV